MSDTSAHGDGAAADQGGGNLRVVIAALAVNIAIALCKLVAAAVSRSTGMLAEALHSLADTANQIFLLIGMRRSRRPPDDEHPFGYGPETYFWAFMVALCIFAVGGSVSIIEGIEKIIHPPEHLGQLRWAFITLGASAVLETYSFSVAMREFREIRAGRGVRRTLREARDPTVLTVLFEDLAALFGLAVAALGLVIAHHTGKPVYDGAASVVVGLALVSVALVLGRDTMSLLIGRSVTDEEQRRIHDIAAAATDVVQVIHIRTIHMGPREVMVGLKLHFRDDLTVHTLEQRINELESSLRSAMPHLRVIYVEPGFDERPLRAAADAASASPRP